MILLKVVKRQPREIFKTEHLSLVENSGPASQHEQILHPKKKVGTGLLKKILHWAE
ncbi:hypothetical protein [Endozoicomonas euniceicola]|uniref:Uncharacterized protein n=1 Tax=Endozoicomonas euniceicola TaxID=1234143 RepID=A0ABY6H1N7_9GAMM|nr:hypothetical protein [Endozoicomonas euniceicola]UYM18722.1 hypothetical protein NX720_12715 [Endozoicomonas euniceicola]